MGTAARSEVHAVLARNERRTGRATAAESGEYPRTLVIQSSIDAEEEQGIRRQEFLALRAATTRIVQRYSPLLGSFDEMPLVSEMDRETLLSLYREEDEHQMLEQVNFVERLAANRGYPSDLLNEHLVELAKELRALDVPEQDQFLQARARCLIQVVNEVVDGRREFLDVDESRPLLQDCGFREGENDWIAGELLLSALVDEAGGACAAVSNTLARLRSAWSGYPSWKLKLAQLVDRARQHVGTC